MSRDAARAMPNLSSVLIRPKYLRQALLFGRFQRLGMTGDCKKCSSRLGFSASQCLGSSGMLTTAVVVLAKHSAEAAAVVKLAFPRVHDLAARL